MSSSFHDILGERVIRLPPHRWAGLIGIARRITGSGDGLDLYERGGTSEALVVELPEGRTTYVWQREQVRKA